MKKSSIHRFLFYLSYPFFVLWMHFRFNFKYKTHTIGKSCLVVSNHCCDFDPIMLSVVLKTHLYFIASEHIFRTKPWGKLLLAVQAPIVRKKGVTASDTAMTAIRRLRKGFNIGLFPEGNCCYNGQSGAIVRSTAKLAKINGVTLVTHRFHGNYMSSPRWSGCNLRKGEVVSEVVNEYTPEQLKKLTVDEVAEIIKNDIYVNSYDENRTKKIVYKSNKRAEYMERCLYLCPSCKKEGFLTSSGNTLRCASCGFSTNVDEYGFFQGDIPYDNLLDWDKWEATELLSYIEKAGDGPVFQDKDITMYEIDSDFNRTDLKKATFKGYRDHFEYDDLNISFDSLPDIALVGKQAIEMVIDGHYYGFDRPKNLVFNSRKYGHLYRAAKDPSSILNL